MTSFQAPNIQGIPGLQAGSSVVSSRGGTFGDNPFLAILVQQLESQTPTDPVDNASLTQQMASLSNMQQQQELNSNLLDLLDYQGLLARLQGLSESSALLGREVTWIGEGGRPQTGVVDSVRVDDSGAVRVVAGDHEFDLRDVTGIRDPGTGAGGGGGGGAEGSEAEPA